MPYLYKTGFGKSAHAADLMSSKRFIQRVRKTTLLKNVKKLV